MSQEKQIMAKWMGKNLGDSNSFADKANGTAMFI